MKKAITTILILLTGVATFAQQKSFATKTIGQWTFEKFPLHYYVTPAKAISTKNVITGRLEFYQEMNQLGQADGLGLTMRADGINPSNASYTYKGEVIYLISFFPSSKTAQSITTYNKDGLLDGYTIYRKLKISGGYTEESAKYDNGVLIEVNGVKQAPFSIIYKDSLLDGIFKFKSFSKDKIFEGIANKGVVVKIKESFSDPQNPGYISVTFNKDSSFTIKCYEYVDCNSFSIDTKFSENGSEAFPYHCKIYLTNSKDISKKNSTGSIAKYSFGEDGQKMMDYPYIYVNPSFSVVDFINVLKNCNK